MTSNFQAFKNQWGQPRCPSYTDLFYKWRTKSSLWTDAARMANSSLLSCCSAICRGRGSIWEVAVLKVGVLDFYPPKKERKKEQSALWRHTETAEWSQFWSFKGTEQNDPARSCYTSTTNLNAFSLLGHSFLTTTKLSALISRETIEQRLLWELHLFHKGGCANSTADFGFCSKSGTRLGRSLSMDHHSTQAVGLSLGLMPEEMGVEIRDMVSGHGVGDWIWWS